MHDGARARPVRASAIEVTSGYHCSVSDLKSDLSFSVNSTFALLCSNSFLFRREGIPDCLHLAAGYLRFIFDRDSCTSSLF